MRAPRPTRWLSTALVLSMLAISIASAMPSIVSDSIQRFEENDTSNQLQNITITESATDPVITAGELRLTIPDDVAILFNPERTQDNIALFGTAVNEGKILELPEVSFENGDKTLVIPVLQDFKLEEEVTISKIYVEGFNERSLNTNYIWMEVSGSEERYQDAQPISVYSSSLEDGNEPAAPTNIQLESTEEGVLITWEDPTDLDLNYIDILRGIAPIPVDGRAYTSVGAGEESYLDTDVEEGDEITYIFRSSDGPNLSSNTGDYTITYTVPTEEVVEEEEVVIEETPEETEEVEEEEALDDIVYGGYLVDIMGHWGEDVINDLYDRFVIWGDDETDTYRPDEELNRAEATVLLWRVMGLIGTDKEPTMELISFTDLTGDEWYLEEVNTLVRHGVVRGNPDGSYEPSEDINRAEFLEMAMNLADLLDHDAEPIEADYAPFTDINESDWFRGVVLAAENEGWVQGYDCDGERCFKPGASVSRAEAAQILHNIFYGLLTQ